jgi:hypothetical protein
MAPSRIRNPPAGSNPTLPAEVSRPASSHMPRAALTQTTPAVMFSGALIQWRNLWA